MTSVVGASLKGIFKVFGKTRKLFMLPGKQMMNRAEISRTVVLAWVLDEFRLANRG